MRWMLATGLLLAVTACDVNKPAPASSNFDPVRRGRSAGEGSATPTRDSCPTPLPYVDGDLRIAADAGRTLLKRLGKTSQGNFHDLPELVSGIRVPERMVPSTLPIPPGWHLWITTEGGALRWTGTIAGYRIAFEKPINGLAFVIDLGTPRGFERIGVAVPGNEQCRPRVRAGRPLQAAELESFKAAGRIALKGNWARNPLGEEHGTYVLDGPAVYDETITLGTAQWVSGEGGEGNLVLYQIGGKTGVVPGTLGTVFSSGGALYVSAATAGPLLLYQVLPWGDLQRVADSLPSGE